MSVLRGVNTRVVLGKKGPETEDPVYDIMTLFTKIFNRTDTWGCGSEGNRDAQPQLHSLLLVPKMPCCHCADSKGHIFMGMVPPAQQMHRLQERGALFSLLRAQPPDFNITIKSPKLEYARINICINRHLGV
ncbi:uncharacterized protein LJ206_011043 isoform 1-T1 [Theristicus caerulescens]